MGDMLVRGIDPDLKRRIEDSARKNGRSLSQEAVWLMRRALAAPPLATQKLGDQLRSVVGGNFFTDAEIEMIAASRKESDRRLPDLPPSE